MKANGRRVSLMQLVKCLLLRNLAHLRALPRRVREARASPFYAQVRKNWPRPRRAAWIVAGAAMLIWIGSLAPLYVFSETSLPARVNGDHVLWGVLAARMLAALALVTAAVFCGARAFGPERGGRCMEQLILLPLNRPRLLLARMLPTLEPLLACGVVLLFLDLAGLLTAALLHGSAVAAVHLVLPVFAISGAIYSTVACAAPFTTGISGLICAVVLLSNLYPALILVTTEVFAVLASSSSQLIGGEEVVPILICISLIVPVVSAAAVILASRAARQIFEPNALSLWGPRRRRWILARYDYGPTMRYLRQFHWWLFLNEDFPRMVRHGWLRAWIRFRRWLAGTSRLLCHIDFRKDEMRRWAERRKVMSAAGCDRAERA